MGKRLTISGANLGLSSGELEKLIETNKSDAEESVSDLAAAMTDAFKQNNASLRNEMRANKGDIVQEFIQHLET